MSVLLAATHTGRGLVLGVALIATSLFHLAFRHYYARRESAVNTARRETAISPVRRMWLIPTSEAANLALGTIVSVLGLFAGIVILALSL
jgi:hypothetical protein